MRLPPLNAIRAFEAAARLGSIARAAAELGVTDSAVSKQIAALEEQIGRRLFERLPGGVELTLEGRDIARRVIPAFEALGDGFQRYVRTPPATQTLRVATVASFAALCLAPALPAFVARHPEIDLEIRTADRLVDLATEDYRLAVRFGDGDWHGLVEEPLSSGDWLAVCQGTAANVARQAGTLLQSHRRIRTATDDAWAPLLRELGLNPATLPAPLLLEHFVVAREAVLAGAGLGLFPELLVRRDLAAGHLHEFAPPVAGQQRFFLAYQPGAERHPAFAAVRDWIRDSAAATRA